MKKKATALWPIALGVICLLFTAPAQARPIFGGGSDTTLHGLNVEEPDAADDGKYVQYDHGTTSYIYDTPAGGGDMTQTVWDGNLDGYIDHDAGGVGISLTGQTGFVQVSGATPFVSFTVGSAVTLDDGSGNSPALVLQDEANATLTVTKLQAGGASLAMSAGNLYVMPAGDSDDYLVFSTASNVPSIGTAGSTALHIKADGGDILFAPDADDDDRIVFSTATNVPQITTDGGANLNINSDGGSISFGDETLATTGTLGAGATTVTGNLVQRVDAEAYLTISTANGGGTSITQTSDGTDSITIGDDADLVIISAGNWDVDADGVISGVTLEVSGNLVAGSGSIVITDDAGNLDGTKVADADLGDITVSTGTWTVTDLTITDEAQGDILYFDGSNWVRLAPGVSGQYLQTQGAAANPQWASTGVSGDIENVGDVSSGAAFTADGAGNTLYFEGATANDYEIIFTAADPTDADYTITLPVTTGTVMLGPAGLGTDNILIRTNGTGNLVQATGISVADTTNFITVASASAGISFGTDPADAGDIRLPNAATIMFEASPADTDVNALTVNSSEAVLIGSAGASAVTITPATTFSGGITDAGTIAAGTWQGTAIADTYVADDITLTSITQITGRSLDDVTDGSSYQRVAAADVNASGHVDILYDSDGTGAVQVTGPTETRAVTIDDAAQTLAARNRDNTFTENNTFGNADTDTLTIRSLILGGNSRAVWIAESAPTPSYASGTTDFYVAGNVEVARTIYAAGGFVSTGAGDSYVSLANNETYNPASGYRIYFEGGSLKVYDGTEKYLIDTAYAPTLTGTTWSFAAVTNLILPHGNDATADASGEIAFDDDDDRLVFQIGATQRYFDFTGDTADYVLKSDGSGHFTLQADATAGTPTWNSVSAPTGDTTIAHDAGEETNFTFTGNYTTGTQFLIQQLTGNPSGGTLFEVRAADGDTGLAKFGDGTNAVLISQAGNMTLAGTALITAGGVVLGDSSPDANGEIGYASSEYLFYGGALAPATSDGGALGSATKMWSDLFLASGGVINFNNGDVTATHAANTLSFAGASSGYNFDATVAVTGGFVNVGVADTTNGVVNVYGNTTSSTQGGALNLHMAADHDGTIDYYTIQPIEDSLLIGTDVDPDIMYLSAAKDLYLTAGSLMLPSGEAINFNAGDVTLTHSANVLTIAGGNLVTNVDEATFTHSGATSFQLVSTSGTVKVEDVVFTGGALSSVASITDGTASWSSSSLSGFVDITTTGDITVGDDLLVSDGGVINFNAGDVTLTHSANTLTLAGGDLALGANNLTLTGTVGSAAAEIADLYLADGGVIYGQNDQSATLTSSASLWTANNFAVTTQFKLPSSDAGPTATAGYIRHDSTVANFTGGAIKYHSGTSEFQVLAMDSSVAGACTGGQVATYDADLDTWKCTTVAGTGDFKADGTVPMTADIELENGETIGNATDGDITLTGNLVVTGQTTGTAKTFTVESGVTNSAQLSDVTGNITLTAAEVSGTLIMADTTGDKIFELPTPLVGYNTIINIAYSGVTVQVISGTTCYVDGTETAGATGATITTGTVGEYFACWTIHDSAADEFRWAIRKTDD